MMQLDYSKLHHTQNRPGTEKNESVEDIKHFRNILTTIMQSREWKRKLGDAATFKTDDVTLPSIREQCMKGYLA